MQEEFRTNRRPFSDAGTPTPLAAPAFTLVELLVVIGIITVLIAILLPVLSKAKASANRTKCLSNVRNMEMAQVMYCNENKNYLIQAGFGHGGIGNDNDIAWFNTLQKYYQTKLVARCPSDDSPYWPPGPPVPNSGGNQHRQTSYGINDFLDENLCPWGPNFVVGDVYKKITQIHRTAATIQFLEMAYDGDFAGSDHVHVENWVGNNVPASAAKNVQINAHGGPPAAWSSTAIYGFLDGHAESLRFRDVFESIYKNKFDPFIAQ